MRVTIDPHTRLLDGGSTIAGGSPYAHWALTTNQAELLRRWMAGGDVDETKEPERELSTRLLLRAMVHPNPIAPLDPTDVTIVVPCRDGLERLRRTLRTLSGLRVIVVDDASTDPITSTALGDDAPATLCILRRTTSAGPGPARNAGLARVETPFVAFIDAGVVIDQDSVLALGRWMRPSTTIVAPRVASEPGLTLTERYDQDHSPIDLGPLPSPVLPGARVPYVPTACWIGRTEALRAVGGFNESIRYGEDVDLIWRMQPGSVRYAPDIQATYQPRTTIVSLAKQRFNYGSGAADLSAEHGLAGAPIRMSPWSAAFWGLVLGGRLFPAASVLVYSVAALRRLLNSESPSVEATRMVAVGNGWAGVTLASASVRAWWPLTSLALCARRTRWGAVALTTVGFGRRLLDRSEDNRCGAIETLLIGAVDDLAAGTGMWAGALRRRSLRCLLPDLVDRTEFE